jgi:hypothetical protein
MLYGFKEFLNRPLRSRRKGRKGKTFESRVNCFQKIVPPLPGCTISFPMASAPIFKVLLIIQQNNPGRDWADFLSAVNHTDGTILPWRPPSLERSERFYFHLFGSAAAFTLTIRSRLPYVSGKMSLRLN